MAILNAQSPYHRQLTRSEALATAQTLSQLWMITNAAVHGDHARSIPATSIHDLETSDLFRLLIPRANGGSELGCISFLDITRMLAQADICTAWCYSLFVAHHWLLGCSENTALQQEVWSETETNNGLVASAFKPASSIEEEGDTYRISGTWEFVSGIDYATWLLVAGRIEGEAVFFCLHRDQFDILDTWHVVAARGTGSKTVIAHSVQVPKHRVIWIGEIREQRRAADEDVSPLTDPCYHFPLFSLMPIALVTPLLGATEAAYTLWRERAQTARTVFTRELLADMSHVKIRTAHLKRQLNSCQWLYQETLTLLTTPLIQTEHRLQIREYCATLASQCIDLVESLLRASGGGVFQEHNRLQQIWRDIHALGSHAALNLDTASEWAGHLELTGSMPQTNDVYL